MPSAITSTAHRARAVFLLMTCVCLQACGASSTACATPHEAKMSAIAVLETSVGIEPGVLYDLEAMPIGVHPYIERGCRWDEGDSRTGCFIPAREAILVEDIRVIQHEMVHAYIWFHVLSRNPAGVVDGDPKHLLPIWEEVLPIMEDACGYND